MDRIEELGAKLKEDPRRWEEHTHRLACALAREMAEKALRELDDDMKETEGDAMEVVAMKPRWVTTVFGDVRLHRRLYRDRDGSHRFLLDERIGLDGRVSPRVRKLAVMGSARYSFREVADILGWLLPCGLSHTTIHRLSAEVADRARGEEEAERRAVYEDGVVPDSEGRVVSHLLTESDGVSVALQREDDRRTEVKLGIAYEGWQEAGKGRYRLKGKTVYAGVIKGERFWQGFSLWLAKKYDLARVRCVVVAGDGASWVKQGVELLGGLYQLSRFHLKRAIRQVLDSRRAGEVYGACVAGEIDKVDRLLGDAQRKARGERAGEIAGLRGYLMANWYGLRDYRLEVDGEGLRGLGAMEGNVDKLIADRMKKRGMSWTRRGADNMARLISLRQMATLETLVTGPARPSPGTVTAPTCHERATNTRGNDTAWLDADLPALRGPHADRPWAEVLRALTRPNTTRLPGTCHPGDSPTNA